MTQTFAENVIRKAIGPSKTEKKYRKILESGHIGEKELIWLRSSMNNSEAVRDMACNIVQTKEIRLDLEHEYKGIEYLRGLWKTPTGRERKNNPFGYREQAILSNWASFTLSDFVDRGQNGYHYFLPVYRCYARTGEYFDYYWNGTGITLI